MSRIPSGDNRGLDAYEHVAVIVAEDITSRFLNVISLLNKTIPLIAIQLRTLDVGGVLTINATTVLDLVRLGTEEEVEPGQATDWNHWVGPGSKASVSLADDMLVLVNEIVPGVDVQYNKHYIGLARDGVANNFVTFRARKERLLAEFRIPRGDEVNALIDDTGVDSLPYDKRWGRYRIRLTRHDIEQHRELLLELTRRAGRTPVEE